MSKFENYATATGVWVLVIMLLTLLTLTKPIIPECIGYPLISILIIMSFVFIYKGLKAKPEKQIETSKGVFYIEAVNHELLQSENRPENRRLLTVNVLFYAIPSRSVESIKLKILNHLIDSGEQPGSVGGSAMTEGGEFNFYIPDSIPKGKYVVHLIAYSKGEKFEFDNFDIDIPKL